MNDKFRPFGATMVAQYGFRYGPCDVVRLHTAKDGGVGVMVRSDHHNIQVSVSKTGRSIVVYKDHKRMKENKTNGTAKRNKRKVP